MTPIDAAGLALLGLKDRRLIAALLRECAGAATAEDHEALPPRHPDEPLLAWACRCRDSPAQRWQDTFDRVTRDAQDQLRNAARLDITPIPFGDARYPPLLAAIGDPPPLLWARGQTTAWSSPAVAIVGSRAATAYALTMARLIAADLCAAGVVVVSGLARGVDAAAHAAVVDAGGPTIGVLGCGLDRIYPSEHKDLAREMESRGAVVSEFPARVPPLPHHFPMRNRIISALSLAVVVVEAPEKSGALITASAAAEQGREVMVVPGLSTGGRNRGGHLLIRDGARVVESASDILQDLTGFAMASPRVDVEVPRLPESIDFTVDDVVARTGEPMPEALARLLDLELTGQIRRVGGGRFVRVLT